MDIQDRFYLGRFYDADRGQVTNQPVLYEPDDLNTHAVVVGMTGSGKTGLCISLLEEAALQNIPALMIDPKGDITNALLHFPDLLPQDFQPWVNPDQARRAGQSLEQAASQAASMWRDGLAQWDIGPERLRSLQNAAHFAVYTPGSDAGIPVSILASLKVPAISWEGNRELLREKISGTVTALLGLVGLTDIDPVRSREHILLANIFENAWSQGRDLDLGELILQTQTPPFPKLGVFDVNTFFPEKDRFELAMMLNNILAAPTFQTWIEGQPLDIPALLYGPDGRPRHSVFYIAHLSEAERMFFVTLLFSAVESWMRAQSGSSALRALVYFDEIFGYLPPISNPASKAPMLRMLKQARAFGVGLILVTQNPVDMDYKALSNAGTWFIGKLQTDQDKQRLLDGLQGAMSGNLDRAAYDRLISGLGKRVFLLHNIHGGGGQLFQTRWAMNYLAGPLTRAQVPALNQLVGAALLPAALVAATPEPAAPQPADALAPASVDKTPTKPLQPRPVQPSEAQPLAGSVTRPSIPAGVAEYFLPNNLTLTQAFKAAGYAYPEQVSSQGLLYRPVLLAQVHVRFLNRKYNLDYEDVRTTVIPSPDRRGVIRWEEFLTASLDPRRLDTQADPRARFATLEAPFTEAKVLKSMESDFLDWAYRSSQVSVRAHEGLKIYAGPEVSQASFRQMCAEAARQGRDAELQKVASTFDRKIDTLGDKQVREERELSEDEIEYNQRRMEEMGTHAENIFGLFGGRKSSRRLSSSLTKRRLTEQAKADVEESLDAIDDFKKQIAALEKEKARALEEVNSRWGETANQVSEITVTPYKKDVLLDLFGVAWFPYHLVQVGDQEIELPGYQAK
ncbi:MAG: DUF87 domain-containing protein [Chloroflexota bacterium]